MDRETIIAQLDGEIRRLTDARNALIGNGATRRSKRSRSGRVWTAAARARQSRAMKVRWAKRKRAKA